MDYKLITRPIPGKPEEPSKYYATIVRPKKADIQEIAKRISDVSPVNELDTESVLLAFVRVLPEFLKKGQTIELGDFGRLSVNIRSSGADTEEEFKKDLIKGNKINFAPGVSVKKEMKNVEYEKVR
ncbi:MAG: HU family DNA-binding protein [Marinifilaceae bacterium]